MHLGLRVEDLVQIDWSVFAGTERPGRLAPVLTPGHPESGDIEAWIGLTLPRNLQSLTLKVSMGSDMANAFVSAMANLTGTVRDRCPILKEGSYHLLESGLPKGELGRRI